MRSFRNELVDAGILQKGKFALRGDQVTDTKVEFDVVLNSPMLLEKTAGFLARMLHKVFPDITAIVTVANGANALGQPIAANMKKLKHPVQFIQTTKDLNVIYFTEEELKKLPGARLAVVDDVLTRATNVTHVGRVAEDLGAHVEGAGVVWRRDMSSNLVLPRHGDEHLPIHALIEEEIPAWEAN